MLVCATALRESAIRSNRHRALIMKFLSDAILRAASFAVIAQLALESQPQLPQLLNRSPLGARWGDSHSRQVFNRQATRCC